jgi:hypothetical protein
MGFVGVLHRILDHYLDYIDVVDIMRRNVLYVVAHYKNLEGAKHILNHYKHMVVVKQQDANDDMPLQVASSKYQVNVLQKPIIVRGVSRTNLAQPNPNLSWPTMDSS